MSDGARVFPDHFSGHSGSYAQYRPAYPPELFAWLAEIAPRRDLAWDAGTGNGQAALGLAAHFRRVIATDASAAQVSKATAHTMVEYRVLPAEAPDFPAASLDLVAAAQAAHWFDLDRFYAGVRRVLRPGGILALWCYTFATVSAAIDAPVLDFYRNTVGPYWPPDRAKVEDRYQSLPFPFPELAVPEFHLEVNWDLLHFLGYIETWSAVQGYIQARGRNPMPDLRAELEPLWGPPDTPRQVRWPLHFRLGKYPG